jgi:ABC-type antimicrobial peptide transport system permease subunit
MHAIDILLMAFLNLWRRKLRAILTVLGMAIGTTSIVVMVSIGIGLSQSVEEQIGQMGSLTKVQVYSDSYRERDADSKDVAELDDDAIETFKGIGHVMAVTPVYNAGTVIKPANM